MKTKIITLFIVLISLSAYSQQKNGELDISSGYFVGAEKVSKREFKNILSENDKALSEFKTGEALKFTGLAFALPSVIYLGAGIGSKSIESEGYIVSGIGVVSGYLLVIAGNSSIRKSVKTYNKYLKNITYEFGVKPNGLSLSLSF